MSVFYEGEPKGFRPEGWIEPVYDHDTPVMDIIRAANARTEQWQREFPQVSNFHYTDQELAAFARLSRSLGVITPEGIAALEEYERGEGTVLVSIKASPQDTQ